MLTRPVCLQCVWCSVSFVAQVVLTFPCSAGWCRGFAPACYCLGPGVRSAGLLAAQVVPWFCRCWGWHPLRSACRKGTSTLTPLRWYACCCLRLTHEHAAVPRCSMLRCLCVGSSKCAHGVQHCSWMHVTVLLLKHGLAGSTLQDCLHVATFQL